MEHFDNPNPFGPNDDNKAGNASTSHHDFASAARDEEKQDSRESRGENSLSKLPTPNDTAREDERPSSGSSRESNLAKQPTAQDDDEDKSKDETFLGKIMAATHDVQAGVIEKVKSTAHKFHVHGVQAHSVSRFLNPTNIRMRVRYGSDSDSNADTQELLWRARDNRKGRNSIAVPRLPTDEDIDTTFLPLQFTPKLRNTAKGIGRNFKRMATSFPYWDMAFWSGWSYTIGSALFVVDGVLAWGPIAYGEDWISAVTEKYGGPLSFFIGALFYQIGAVAAYLEAVNDGSFHGAAMRRLLEGREDENKKMLDEKIHHFFSHLNPHHRHREETYSANVDPELGWQTKEARHLRPGSIYPTDKTPAPRRGAVDMGGEEGDQSVYMTWRWWPSWKALRTHHVYEIGYLACTIQLFGVTLYGVTAIVILPGILDSLAWWQELGAFWVPQAVAAACFLIASLMFMFETQKRWWKPEFGVVGWWVGAWATVGSVGFELIAIFGILSHTHEWAEYQSDLATIWGSAAYFICSFLQWYEAMDKDPIKELFEPGEMKSSQVHPI